MVPMRQKSDVPKALKQFAKEKKIEDDVSNWDLDAFKDFYDKLILQELNNATTIGKYRNLL